MSRVDLSNLFQGNHFRLPSVLYRNGFGVKLNSLIDTGAQGFLFINLSIAFSITRSLQIPIQKLPYKVTIRGFQDSIESSVTHYLRLHLRIDGRTILNCPFVILDLGAQDCIIGLKWMKRFKLRLDTEHNQIIWPLQYPSTYEPSPPILRRFLPTSKAQEEVIADIRRRDALWGKEEARQKNSPGARILSDSGVKTLRDWPDTRP